MAFLDGRLLLAFSVASLTEFPHALPSHESKIGNLALILVSLSLQMPFVSGAET